MFHASFFCLVVLLIGLHAGGVLNAATAEAERIQAQLEGLIEQLNGLDAWLSEAERKRSRLLKDLREQDRIVAEAAGAVATSDATLVRMATEMARLDEERNELMARQTREAGRIGEHLAAAYRLRGQDVFRLLLDQGSSATLERLLIYHRYLIDARMDALDSYQQASAQLRRNAEALALRQAAERQERQRLVVRERELDRTRTQRRALIATLDRDVEDKAGRREALLRDQERLEALFAELQQRSADLDGKGFAARRGALPWPLDGMAVNRFGGARADGRLRWHGLLLESEPGMPVKAVFRGRVVFADWLRGFGLLTILDHGGGYMTLYGHAERLAKRPGDMVEGGEVVAHAGQSGGTRASGLYFEIRRNGKAVDPRKWVVKRG